MEDISMVENGIYISASQKCPLISDNKPETRQETNRKIKVSMMYPDSFLTVFHVFKGVSKIPFALPAIIAQYKTIS